MTIKHVIVHKLDRSPDSDQLLVTPAQQSLSSSPSLEVALDDLLQTYNKKQDKCYGQFTDLSDDGFPALLTNYYDEQLDFTTLTHKALNQLVSHLDEAGALGTGFVLFADYQQGLTRYFLLCMLSSQNSIAITEDLAIVDSSYLDTSKMTLACRMNITEWQNASDAGRYLSFLRPKGGKRLNTVFQEALGCSETSNSKDEANALVQAVQDYCNEEPSTENRTVVKRQVYDYCQSKLEDGEALSMKELTGYLEEAGPDEFARFVNTRDYDMDAPMVPEKRTLTKLVRYTGRSKGLSLSFDGELLGQQIRYDAHNDQLIISGLPDTLKEQLKKS